MVWTLSLKFEGYQDQTRTGPDQSFLLPEEKEICLKVANLFAGRGAVVTPQQ
jgi:hypothetical protein